MGPKEGRGLYKGLKFGEGESLALWYRATISCIGSDLEGTKMRTGGGSKGSVMAGIVGKARDCVIRAEK